MRRQLFIVFLLPCGCSNLTGNDFRFIPLEEYESERVEIGREEVFDLIAFSGGPKDEDDNIYYYQFIGIQKSTGDTVKILAPFISTPGDTDKNHIHTTPLQYNPDKRITSATLRPLDSTHTFLLQHDYLEKMRKNNEGIDPSVFTTITQKQIVVVNNVGLFRNRYPAAVGILHFDGVPW